MMILKYWLIIIANSEWIFRFIKKGIIKSTMFEIMNSACKSKHEHV